MIAMSLRYDPQTNTERFTRAGVAVGTHTEWTSCANEVEALRRFLNDDMVS